MDANREEGTERCVPAQLDGTPEWGELRRLMTIWCERNREKLLTELAKCEDGSSGHQTVTGAIEFCSEIPSILERSPDYSSAWSSVGKAGNAGLWAPGSQQAKNFGRFQVMCSAVLGLQTGHLRDLELPLDDPFDRRERVGDVTESIDIGKNRSKEEFEEELAQAYREQGIEPRENEIKIKARSLEAASGPKHLQGLRAVGILGSIAGQVIHAVRQAGNSSESAP